MNIIQKLQNRWAKLSARTQIVGLLSLFFLPIFLAYFSYHQGFWSGKSTVNQGVLVSEQQQHLPAELRVKLRFGDWLPLSAWRGQWVLAYVVEHCDAACVQQTEQMRQLRLALGRDQQRVSRMLVTLDSSQVDRLTAKCPSGMSVVAIDPNQYTRWVSWEHQMILIDPHGNLVVYYPPQIKPKMVLKDLKRLLAVSQIG